MDSRSASQATEEASEGRAGSEEGLDQIQGEVISENGPGKGNP